MNHRRPTSHMVIVGLRLFVAEIFSLIKSPVFILLTVLGNSLIGLFSLIFFWIDASFNPIKDKAE